MNKFALTGHPLGHSMSPLIHDRLFALSGFEAEPYKLIDIAPEDIPSSRPVFEEYMGMNVTIPHKQAVIPLMDELGESARRYNSVNCIKNDSGRLIGYNTDCDGFLRSVELLPISENVVILGCGGVARVMAYEAVQAGAKLTFAVREEDKPMCKALINDIISNFPNADVSLCLISEINCDIDLLVNATPLGMIPRSDLCPVSDKIIAKSSAVFDAVYNPLETVLIKKAKANGSRAVGGMSMLVYQAACAQTIWNGSHFEKEAIDEICAAASEELMNR